MKIRVGVYDDEERLVKRFADKLRQVKVPGINLDVIEIGTTKFPTEWEKVRKRQFAIRSGKKIEESDTIFDNVEIFIVDFDLIKSFPTQGHLTAEDVSYLLRSFSRCPLLVGLNHYGRNPFDLTLSGHPGAFTDLDLGQEQIANAGLWGGKVQDGFRPWYWPQLPRYLEAFKLKVKYVLDRFDSPISEILGIEPLLDQIPSRVLSFFNRDLKKMTPTDFVMKSGRGLKPKEGKPNKEAIARITTARLSKWLERMILPGQSVFVDAPRLVSRFPSLLLKDPSDIKSWNSTTEFDSVTRLGIRRRLVNEFEFKDFSFWFSRPVWIWKGVSSHQRIGEVVRPWEKKSSEFVFAEDSGRFHIREQCREFWSDVESPYVKRYIRRFRGVKYEPQANMHS